MYAQSWHSALTCFLSLAPRLPPSSHLPRYFRYITTLDGVSDENGAAVGVLQPTSARHQSPGHPLPPSSTLGGRDLERTLPAFLDKTNKQYLRCPPASEPVTMISTPYTPPPPPPPPPICSTWLP
eukprot:766137-Hanusia_phi.AAC.3